MLIHVSTEDGVWHIISILKILSIAVNNLLDIRSRLDCV